MRKLLLALPALTLALFSEIAGADTRYNRPAIDGYRLDICREWGTNCGRPAADAFCQRLGHPRAVNFQIDHDIGARNPTKVISTGQICNASFCDGFRTIDCAGNVGGGGGQGAQRFRSPTVRGYRLDWCREWGVNCGRPAADAFCRTQGFRRSSGFDIAPDIGARTPTRVITSGQICGDAYCDGFRYIDCVGRAGGGGGAQGQRQFRNPMFRGARLDWCREWGVNCGQPAADAFCRLRGFTGAARFSMAPDIGARAPTRVISSGQICDQAYCDGFRMIVCRR